MDVSDLADFNPWWKDPSSIHSDLKMAEYERSKVKWLPRLRKYIDLSGDRIYTLRGPRQVGKTTQLKLIIRELIEDHSVDPMAILYFTCDTFSRPNDIVDTVRAYLAFSSGLPKGARSYIFIDEVSAVEGWSGAVKLLADTGELRGKALVLTGSHSLDIKHSAERLPGRRGTGGGPLDKILLPMKFSEYVFALRPDLAKPLATFHNQGREERFAMFRKLFEGEIDDAIRTELMLYSKELRHVLDAYMLTGGIVRAIEENERRSRISSDTYELYLNAVMGDLARWRYHDSTAKRILRSIVEKMTTRVSSNGIAEENGIGSHNMVSSYLDALENSFVLNVFYQVALDDRLPSYREDSKKVYVTDPFIYHALRGWVKGDADYYRSARDAVMDKVERSRIVEMVVGDHLIRCSYGMTLSDLFSHHEHVFHHRSKRSDREVDFVLRDGKALLPVEVKYQGSVSAGDLRNLYPLGHGVVVTGKEMWAHRTYSALPAEFFLMLI